MKAASLLPDFPAGARILIIRLRSIGDIILLTPTLRLLKEWRPDLRLSVMVESRFRELLEGNPAVEEILIPGEGSGARKLLSRLAVIRSFAAAAFLSASTCTAVPPADFLRAGAPPPGA